MKCNVVSLIKELNEPKICSKKDKKNHDQKNNIFDKECKNKINVLSSTIRSIDEIPRESNHDENADENNVNCHDRICDRNMVKNNFNSNNNDKSDDIKSIVNYKNHDISDSKNSNISENFNKNVNVHNNINSNYDNDDSVNNNKSNNNNDNNSNYDNDNNNHRSKDIKYSNKDPFAFEIENDNDYEDDDFEGEVQNKLCIYDQVSHNDIIDDTANNKNNDVIDNNTNKNDVNENKKNYEKSNFIDNYNDSTIATSEIIPNTQEVTITDKKEKKSFKKETKIRPKSAGGTINASNDDIKLLMSQLGFGVENKKVKNNNSVSHIKSKLIDYEKKCNNVTDSPKSSSDVKNTNKMKDNSNDWRNFFLNDDLLNPEMFYNNNKNKKFQKNPEIKRIDKIINKIRRKNDLLEPETKWTPRRLLDLVENKNS